MEGDRRAGGNDRGGQSGAYIRLGRENQTRLPQLRAGVQRPRNAGGAGELIVRRPLTMEPSFRHRTGTGFGSVKSSDFEERGQREQELQHARQDGGNTPNPVAHGPRRPEADGHHPKCYTAGPPAASLPRRSPETLITEVAGSVPPPGG
jgi:hypothetical protein